jgi:hypothetical protein
MELQFMLLKVSSDPSAVLFQKSYREAVAVTGEEPEAVIAGWNGALGKILAALEADLAGRK